jgi:hypothetical protein
MKDFAVGTFWRMRDDYTDAIFRVTGRQGQWIEGDWFHLDGRHRDQHDGMHEASFFAGLARPATEEEVAELMTRLLER